MSRKPSAAVQRRAKERQRLVAWQAQYGAPRWLCGGCGTTIFVPGELSREECPHVWQAIAALPEGSSLPAWEREVLATAVACPEPACDAVVVRCVRCGGERAAREALARHQCRAVTT